MAGTLAEPTLEVLEASGSRLASLHHCIHILVFVLACTRSSLRRVCSLQQRAGMRQQHLV